MDERDLQALVGDVDVGTSAFKRENGGVDGGVGKRMKGEVDGGGDCKGVHFSRFSPCLPLSLLTFYLPHSTDFISFGMGNDRI